MSWLDELDRELRAARVPTGRRRRIVAELDDHLRCDPEAVPRLGDPGELARRFADEVGTARARHAAFGVFLALAPFGLLFGVMFALLGPAGYGPKDATPTSPGVVIGAQLAFVGGMLALLRAWRLRRELVVPAAESAILLRRVALGLGGGLLTVASIAVSAAQLPAQVASWFAPLAYATAAVGALTLGPALVLTVRAVRLRPAAAGPFTGDLEADLGPLVPARLRGKPWRIALVIAGLVALCIAADGVLGNDPFDGLARAILDGGACLAGYGIFGRFFGLRR
ncbi:MAG: hypothetical protein ACYDCH_06710 [Gaiellaceae bacterium]